MRIVLFMMGVVLIVAGVLVMIKPSGYLLNVDASRKVYDLDSGRAIIQRQSLLTLTPLGGGITALGGVILIVLALRPYRYHRHIS